SPAAAVEGTQCRAKAPDRSFKPQGSGGLSYYANMRYFKSRWNPRSALGGIQVVGYNTAYNAVAHVAFSYGYPLAVQSGLVLGGTTHTDAGIYNDTWAFSYPNYVSQSGTVTDVITKANAIISVQPYNETYNGVWHNATGSATGVNGAPLNGLTVNSAHVNVGDYADSWSFTDSTGNYNNASGTMT